MRKNWSYIFQSVEDRDEVYVVSAASEVKARAKFRTYLKDLDMDLDPDTIDYYELLEARIIE